MEKENRGDIPCAKCRTEDNPVWTKHRIGKMFGNTIFVELPPGLSGKEHNDNIQKCASFLEQSFRNSEFIDHLKEVLQE